MTAQEAQTLIGYSGWASQKILDAALQLSAEELERPRGISHESIAGTLNHIYWADRAWFERLVAPGGPMPPKSTFDETALVWPDLLRAWTRWAAALGDADTSRAVLYKSIHFGEATSTVDQIVMHVVNHATLHRGQVMGMLRQMGIAPPPTDMIYYFRGQRD